MRYRTLGKTGWQVSEVSFGAWAVGGTWGPVDDEESLKALHKAIDLGVNFVDTADVYGDGRSEKLMARLKKERKEQIYVATKAGRRLDPHTADGYNAENLKKFVERSLQNLETDTIDLLQLHCPPNEVFYRPEVFQALDGMVQEGKLRHYGVSVEKVEEALKALDFPGVASVQIIFNIFRQRPADRFFQAATEANVGILARLPLSSGMLTGKLRPDSTFSPDDHRSFNRDGAAFDKGETFSGLNYAIGLEAVEELRRLVPEGWTMTEMALRWILMHEAVSCAIPGAKTPAQAESNAKASELPPLAPETMKAIRALYDRKIKAEVHDRW